MKKTIFLFFVLALSFQLQAQNIDYAREVLSKLTAKNFHGRGYLKKGDEKAAHYLARQFGKNNVQKLSWSHPLEFQPILNHGNGDIGFEFPSVYFSNLFFDLKMIALDF